MLIIYFRSYCALMLILPNIHDLHLSINAIHVIFNKFFGDKIALFFDCLISKLLLLLEYC